MIANRNECQKDFIGISDLWWQFFGDCAECEDVCKEMSLAGHSHYLMEIQTALIRLLHEEERNNCVLIFKNWSKNRPSGLIQELVPPKEVILATASLIWYWVVSNAISWKYLSIIIVYNNLRDRVWDSWIRNCM